MDKVRYMIISQPRGTQNNKQQTQKVKLNHIRWTCNSFIGPTRPIIFSLSQSTLFYIFCHHCIRFIGYVKQNHSRVHTHSIPQHVHNNEFYNKRFPHHSYLSNQQQSQFPNELICTPHKHDEIKEHDMPFKKKFRKHISRNTH